jgi:hypothetical protein
VLDQAEEDGEQGDVFLGLTDTTRHAGHADILREQLDGRTGVAPWQEEPIDAAARAAHCAKIELAAKAAAQVQGRAAAD